MSQTRELMYAETLLDIAMNHSDSLVIEAIDGNKRAQGKLVSLWYKRVYNFSFKYFADHDLATEISQKTFISMYRNISRLQSADSFKAWIYRIVTNYCHEETRRQKRKNKRSEVDIESEEIEGKQAVELQYNPEKQFKKNELSELLLEALNTLAPEQKEVVIMKEYEGLKFREIADILQLSENTVKSRLYYGLKSLKKILTRRNITKETVDYEL
ncbi:MAG: RNA polymerase sigma factor [Bacteroidota bacterium]